MTQPPEAWVHGADGRQVFLPQQRPKDWYLNLDWQFTWWNDNWTRHHFGTSNSLDAAVRAFTSRGRKLTHRRIPLSGIAIYSLLRAARPDRKFAAWRKRAEKQARDFVVNHRWPLEKFGRLPPEIVQYIQEVLVEEQEQLRHARIPRKQRDRTRRAVADMTRPLNPQARALYSLMQDTSPPTLVCPLSLEELARRLDRSTRSVYRALKTLRERELVHPHELKLLSKRLTYGPTGDLVPVDPNFYQPRPDPPPVADPIVVTYE